MKESAKIIDGRIIADKIKNDISRRVTNMDKKPGLAAILVGDDKASELYVKLKKKACEFTGIDFHRYNFEGDYRQKEIIETIEFLNADPSIDAILVQLPLPKKYNEDKIISAIDPKKDVDGFHPENIKKLLEGKPFIISPAALGIMELIKAAGRPLENQNILIICNSKLFSEPLKYLLGKKNSVMAVSQTHKDLAELGQKSDILIVAIGQPEQIGKEFVKPGAIVIDVGINESDGETVGDVNFFDVCEKAGFITPVPGGVGPMTVAMLLENVLKLHEFCNHSQ
ncbi:MAG TPA: bifunctional 5,10-methylenetetrahydrofolate dehydrogenase/5,10-methenyltetrahydrofolate cyclohydrolase [Candidatus Bipolaricaulota bacterium]|nr:bifunctional 5,10-methylenetetrahydrofolate dehydrogenase/5,10-methenyltetrahydrofolate cyclohydrolase [Candidatus Bipolaricaulota bacterium]